MSEISDVIQEKLEHAGENRLNSFVALCVAITATFMAICNVKDGNIVQAMSQAQAHGIDAWSYFQAKSTKQTIAEGNITLLQASTDPKIKEKTAVFEEQVKRYEEEKTTIKKQAEGFEKEYNDLNLFDDQFDMTEALLTISIALYGIASLTKKYWLFFFALALSTTGILLGVTAFMKISLHSDWVSSILG